MSILKKIFKFPFELFMKFTRFLTPSPEDAMRRTSMAMPIVAGILIIFMVLFLIGMFIDML